MTDPKTREVRTARKSHSGCKSRVNELRSRANRRGSDGRSKENGRDLRYVHRTTRNSDWRVCGGRKYINSTNERRCLRAGALAAAATRARVLGVVGARGGRVLQAAVGARLCAFRAVR